MLNLTTIGRAGLRVLAILTTTAKAEATAWAATMPGARRLRARDQHGRFWVAGITAEPGHVCLVAQAATSVTIPRRPFASWRREHGPGCGVCDWWRNGEPRALLGPEFDRRARSLSALAEPGEGQRWQVADPLTEAERLRRAGLHGAAHQALAHAEYLAQLYRPIYVTPLEDFPTIT
ncbi:hypothetical protein AB0M43_36175 [Longispora sp. NPDC051575]|uniref:hypothetical protein n=1 Tax=Longispora sp. NPDC051575 TaxID=3154943 RepID=UPI00341C4DE4